VNFTNYNPEKEFFIMNTKKLASFAILALALLASVNSASAGCVYGCPNSDGSFTPSSNVSPVNPQLSYQPPATFSVKGGGFHQGNGTGFAYGDQGFSKTVLGGSTNVATTLNASGNLCGGISCTSGNYTLQGSSWQGSETSAGALSTVGHSVASAGNSGSAKVGLEFTKH